MYVCIYGEGDRNSGSRGFDERTPVPFHDAKNGGKNVLLVNHGGFSFTDETESVGLGANNDRWSFSASWEDYDDDGDPDLYVANDFGRNCMYRNDAGYFTENAKRLGLEDTGAGMSVSWGDYDRDGIFDLYVGNMFSAAGNRVGRQDKFAPDRDLPGGQSRGPNTGTGLKGPGRKSFSSGTLEPWLGGGSSLSRPQDWQQSFLRRHLLRPLGLLQS